MICPKCSNTMFISSWDGWIWTCGHCDHQGRPATDQEVEANEKVFNPDSGTPPWPAQDNGKEG